MRESGAKERERERDETDTPGVLDREEYNRLDLAANHPYSFCFMFVAL